MYVNSLNGWATNNVVSNTNLIKVSDDRENLISWSPMSAQISTQTAPTVNIYYMKMTKKLYSVYNLLLAL